MIADAQVDRPVSSRSPSPNDMDNDNCLNSLGVPPLACQGKEGILHFAFGGKETRISITLGGADVVHSAMQNIASIGPRYTEKLGDKSFINT